MSLDRHTIEARVSHGHLKHRHIKLVACTQRYSHWVLFPQVRTKGNVAFVYIC